MFCRDVPKLAQKQAKWSFCGANVMLFFTNRTYIIILFCNNIGHPTELALLYAQYLCVLRVFHLYRLAVVVSRSIANRKRISHLWKSYPAQKRHGIGFRDVFFTPYYR